MRFQGLAYVTEAAAESNPDAYLCLDSDVQQEVVLRTGSRNDMYVLQLLADALNEWMKNGREAYAKEGR